jgi:hypothetical protein
LSWGALTGYFFGLAIGELSPGLAAGLTAAASVVYLLLLLLPRESIRYTVGGLLASIAVLGLSAGLFVDLIRELPPVGAAAYVTVMALTCVVSPIVLLVAKRPLTYLGSRNFLPVVVGVALVMGSLGYGSSYLYTQPSCDAQRSWVEVDTPGKVLDRLRLDVRYRILTCEQPVEVRVAAFPTANLGDHLAKRHIRDSPVAFISKGDTDLEPSVLGVLEDPVPKDPAGGTVVEAKSAGRGGTVTSRNWREQTDSGPAKVDGSPTAYSCCVSG